MQWNTATAMILMVVTYNLTVEAEIVREDRVLFINPISAKSHSIFYRGIINALAAEGMQVTYVSPFKANQMRSNVREVMVSVDITPHIPSVFQGHSISVTTTVASAAPTLCSDALAEEQVQNLLKEEFDVVIISIYFNDCFLSLVHRMNVPFILVTPSTMTEWLASTIGSPQFPAFRGSLLLGYKHPLTFPQRFISIFTDIYFLSYMTYFIVPRIEAECRSRGLCPTEMPSLLSMKNNASMMLLNSVTTLDIPVYPTMPNEVYLGGIHCSTANPLSKDLEEWVRGAGEAGFIYFSLGSNIQPSMMPEESRLILVSVLGSLPQRVLWKWDQDTMPNLPSNIRLAKWFPQQDILGDPGLRLFITHGGLLSTQEATYNGVPVLGLPFFADQHNNMQDVQDKGWGRYLLWKDVTKETLRDAIHLVLNDENMRLEAQRRAALMRDQAQAPAKVAAYWVQYVIRHTGAIHLRSPALTMPWYRLYNVDVWTVVAVMVVAVTYFFFQLLVCLSSSFCGRKHHKQKCD